MNTLSALKNSITLHLLSLTRIAACTLLCALMAAPAHAEGQAEKEAEVARQLREIEARGFVKRGKQFLGKGEYAEAREAFQGALARRPDDKATQKLLAETELALGTANAMGSVRERQAFRGEQLVRQAEMGVFEAEKALKQKQYAKAAAQADRVLANARYIENSERARSLRTRAEGVLQVARPAQKAEAQARRQADLDRVKADADVEGAQSTGERVRDLRERGYKAYRAGRLDDALESASKMLRIDPGNRHAIQLQDEVRLAHLSEKPTLAGVPKERRENTDGLLDTAVKEMKIDEGIESEVVLAGDKDKRSIRALDRPMEAWERDAHTALEQYTKLGFDNVPLHEAVETIRKVSNLNIIIDPSFKARETLVTFPEARMPVGSILGWVGKFAGLDYTLRNGAVLLTTPTGMMRGSERRIYDVAAFLAPVEDSVPVAGNGPLEPFAAPADYNDPGDQSNETIGKGWADFIRLTIQPGTWRQEGAPRVKQEEAPQFSIQYRNGRIVVVHTPEVHEQIEELLNNFRKARNLQVHIVARFIELNKGYIDELSVSAVFQSSLAPTNNGKTRKHFMDGDVTQDPNVGDPARFGGFGSSGGLDMVYTWAGDDVLQVLLHAVLKERKGSVLQALRLTCFNTQRANVQVLTNHNYVRRV
ncbi:hypothetical protein HQ560_09710, partial [bacterium]|nr:hypothetical protein [bacterium]